MKIEPPKDDGIDIKLLIAEDEVLEFTKEQYEYIKERLSKPTWICSKCNLTNHYYNRKCAWIRCDGKNPYKELP